MRDIVAHTAGPWTTAANYSARTMVRAGDENTGQIICTAFVTHAAKTREGNLRRIRENEANARLIAAAPDLLSALTAALIEMEALCGAASLGEIAQAKKAIAKATGEVA